MKTIKIIAAALAAMTMVMSCQSQGSSELKNMLPKSSEIDSVSYLVGIQLGSFLKGQLAVKDASELNFAEVKKGMNDIIKNEDPKGYNDTTFAKQFKVSPYEMQKVLGAYIQKKMDYTAEKNRLEGEKFLGENGLKANVGTTESGLQYTIIAEGAAEKIGPRDTVWVNYKGTLLDGKVFDENDSTQFVANRVIKGWTEGLGLLGEGGKATLYIPSDLAYGQRGTRGIEPNSTLIFDVEVLKVGKFMPKED
ncbi:MAG: FKBP-type peptidyl-prolyl cis-trans isomerase [Bacteroidales bacterium]|nr:FKBP-type peptidyl-prolyl cis-trans isomerase [Bacteroidales bacterium]